MQREAAVDGGGEGMFARAAEAVRTASVAERERLHAEAERERLTIDTSHPPTTWRLDVVRAHPQPGNYRLDEVRAAQVDAEIARLAARVERVTADLFRDRLYE
jgi:hypothetical protein